LLKGLEAKLRVFTTDNSLPTVALVLRTPAYCLKDSTANNHGHRLELHPAKMLLKTEGVWVPPQNHYTSDCRNRCIKEMVLKA